MFMGLLVRKKIVINYLKDYHDQYYMNGESKSLSSVFSILRLPCFCDGKTVIQMLFSIKDNTGL